MTQQTQPDRKTKETASHGAVSNLAAKMAHELNNPLDAVLRFVSLAQRKAKTGDYGDLDRYLSDAQFGLQRMAEVLRELMDIGRETHQILAHSAAVPLADLVGRAMRTAAAQAEQKNVSLMVKSLMPENASPAFDLRVAQVLSNLMKNAVEAAPEGSTVRLTIQPLEQNAKRWIAIIVEDRGPGVRPELLPELFTAFVTSKTHGIGLGLAISRELMVALGGTLTLENRTDGQTGCIATMMLPLPEAPALSTNSATSN